MKKKTFCTFMILYALFYGAFATDILTVTSPDFENNGRMQIKNSGYGEDISPTLNIENIPPVSKIPSNIPKGRFSERIKKLATDYTRQYCT